MTTPSPPGLCHGFVKSPNGKVYRDGRSDVWQYKPRIRIIESIDKTLDAFVPGNESVIYWKGDLRVVGYLPEGGEA